MQSQCSQQSRKVWFIPLPQHYSSNRLITIDSTKPKQNALTKNDGFDSRRFQMVIIRQGHVYTSHDWYGRGTPAFTTPSHLIYSHVCPTAKPSPMRKYNYFQLEWEIHIPFRSLLVGTTVSKKSWHVSHTTLFATITTCPKLS